MREFPEFGKIDLGRLSMAGCLLMIVTIASIFVVALAERRLLLSSPTTFPGEAAEAGWRYSSWWSPWAWRRASSS